MYIDWNHLLWHKEFGAIDSVLLALHRHREQLLNIDDFLREYPCITARFTSTLSH